MYLADYVAAAPLNLTYKEPGMELFCKKEQRTYAGKRDRKRT